MRGLVDALALLLLAGCGAGASSVPAASGSTAATLSVSPGSTCHYRGSGGDVLPDPTCTPGVADPTVTQANIQSTICRRGYTATVRPPVSYTNQLKRQQMVAYRVVSQSPHGYEEDHLISLELGGSPRDQGNLWPEPGGSPNKKDGLENRLHGLVCSGNVPLVEAQKAISTDWVAAYAKYMTA